MEEKEPINTPAQSGVNKQSAESVPPQLSKPHSMSPIVWFGLGLLVVVLGGGYYLLSNRNPRITQSPTSTPVALVTTSPTTEPTANWKTYKTEYYAFSYPQEWEVKKTNVYDSGNETEFEYNFGKPFYIRERGNYNQLTGTAFVSLEEHLGAGSMKYKDIKVDSQRAKFISSEGEPGHVLAFEEVVFFTTDKSMIVSLYYQPDYFKSEVKTLDLILSTFRFVDQAGVLNWVTYTDTKTGFSIEYPPNWRKVEFQNGVGVGPPEIREDVKWAVNYYDKSESSKEKIISDVGSQFLDRKETRDNITINDLFALKVTITTNELQSWYEELIIIESESKIYSISNGAIKDSNFRSFYNSFRLLN